MAEPPKDSERNRMSARAVRYARVGANVGGVAAKIASQRFLGVRGDRATNAAQLAAVLGGLKGPLMKVAQLLANIPDALPPEYATELMKLQSEAPPMGWPFVKRRMAAELGPDWEKKFGSFTKTPAAAASLGQVHQATTLDGEKVAAKLQYPDMQSAVEADLSQLGVLLSIYRRMSPEIDTREIQTEIGARLREELDYKREAKHAALYKDLLRDVPQVRVPNVWPELSTLRLLTLDWLEGKKLLAYKDHDLETRNRLASALFHAWWLPFSRFGVIHGDPHLGNYTVRPDNGINLLDFGCIRIFRPELIQGVIQLYHALHDDKPELAIEAYKAWGFHNPNKALIDVLNIWAQFIYAPILEDKARLIEETNSGLYGRETAFKVHREMRKLGGVTIPREFVFIDRASIGLGAVFLRLKARINWHRLFNGLISDFDAKWLATRQHKALKSTGLSAQSSS